MYRRDKNQTAHSKRIFLHNFRNICVYISEKAGNPDVDTREATPLSDMQRKLTLPKDPEDDKARAIRAKGS